MIGHTPGPWRFEENEEGSIPEHGEACRYIRAEGKHGALMGGVKYYPWTPSNRADWMLIAAAPDLLAVCRNIKQRFADEGTYDSDLDAAIAKAETV